jgi:hypothetical protein
MYEVWLFHNYKQLATESRPMQSPWQKIIHASGLLQGGLISPVLFVLSMEVLIALIRKATDANLSSGLAG